MSACGVCEAPTGDDGRLCTDHTDQLLGALYSVPDLVGDMLVAYTRQSNFRGTEKLVGKSTETPVPWDERISARLGALRNVLVLWAYAIGSSSTSAPRTVDPKDPARIQQLRDVAVICSRMVADGIDRVRQHGRAGDLYSDITSAVSSCRRVIDRPMDRKFLGVCSMGLEGGGVCETDLYGHPKRATAVCPGCGAEHDVEHRREVLLSAVHDQRVTYAEAERALPDLLGRPVKGTTLRKWVHDRRIVPEGYRHAGTFTPSRISPHDQPLLLVGDIVREYARVLAAERAERAAA